MASGGVVRIIRPAAVLDEHAAMRVVRELERRDVTLGGVWSATPVLWQRYDREWDGPRSTPGTANLIGSIATVYDTPHRRHITIYKVTVTERGRTDGWSVESLSDDALIHAGLTLATCPRADLSDPPERDPFWRRT